MSKKFSSFKKHQVITESFRQYLNEGVMGGWPLDNQEKMDQKRARQWKEWQGWGETTKALLESLELVFGDIMSKDSATMKHIQKLSKGDQRDFERKRSIVMSGHRLFQALKDRQQNIINLAKQDLKEQNSALEDKEMEDELEAFTNLQPGGELYVTIRQLPEQIMAYIDRWKHIGLDPTMKDQPQQHRITVMSKDLEQKLRAMAGYIRQDL